MKPFFFFLLACALIFTNKAEAAFPIRSGDTLNTTVAHTTEYSGLSPLPEHVGVKRKNPGRYGILSFCLAMGGLLLALPLPFLSLPAFILAIIYGSKGFNKPLKGLAIAGFALAALVLLALLGL